MEDHTKKCRECGVTKPVTEYYRYGSGATGRVGTCKPCYRARVRAWQAAHPERQRVYQARYRLRLKQARQAAA